MQISKIKGSARRVVSNKRLTILLAMVVLLGGQMVQSAHIHSTDYFDGTEVHSLSDCAVCYSDAGGDGSALISRCGFSSVGGIQTQKSECLLAHPQTNYSQSTARGPPH